MRRVLFLNPYQDTGGVGISFQRAFQRWAPDWSARHVRRSNNYISYEADIEWPGGTQSPEVAKLYREADVLHVMERPEILGELGSTNAKIVVHHLGSFYRSDPGSVSAQCKALGAIEVTSGDLLGLQPHLRYLPIPAMELDRLAALRKPRRPSGRLRIAHAPTNREAKGTEGILAAVKRLQGRHKLIFDLIEGVPWAECVKRKARADIYVDETRLGYGLNAMECWAMGIPVVSGITDPIARDRMIADFGGLPFLETTEAMVETTLEMLITDPVLRAEWGERGRAHVQAVHHPKAVVERTIAIYEEA
ncbi:MAG TPA: hypothetical protein VJT72_05590 [Pseudonocardiaceae bacterium]|nr:hypothetical protein [Pseudonocardiaceae bacterium]